MSYGPLDGIAIERPEVTTEDVTRFTNAFLQDCAMKPVILHIGSAMSTKPMGDGDPYVKKHSKLYNVCAEILSCL